MPHARHDIDRVIHSPVRFSILAFLIGLDECEFGVLRDEIEVSDSGLSQHLAVLENAGYVGIAKRRVGRQSRTYVSCTDSGEDAFGRNLAALDTIRSGSGQTEASSSRM